MPRPINCRRITGEPGARVYRPAGVPACRLEWLKLTLDEFEALRLADLDGLHQKQAATRMRVSRQTFGRIVENARRKVARALSSGMALSIEGGPVCTAGRWSRHDHNACRARRREMNLEDRSNL
jgi:predicted DNA-binding protein (UPF0251 family)